MSNHKINRKDIEDFIPEVIIAASGKKALKAEVCIARNAVGYRVTRDGQLVRWTLDLDDAIESYNDTDEGKSAPF